MAKEVKVSIIVDDNGTMRLTEKSAKKLGASLDKAGKAAQNADRQLKGAAQASSNFRIISPPLKNLPSAPIKAESTSASRTLCAALDSSSRMVTRGSKGVRRTACPPKIAGFVLIIIKFLSGGM